MRRKKKVLKLVKYGMNGNPSWSKGLVSMGGGEAMLFDGENSGYRVPGVYTKKEIDLANEILKITKRGSHR